MSLPRERLIARATFCLVVLCLLTLVACADLHLSITQTDETSASPGHLTFSCGQGRGEFDLCLGRVGNLNRMCQVYRSAGLTWYDI